MIGNARRMLVIIAALFLSAGHIACACASAAAPMTPAKHSDVELGASADPHAHHQAGAEHSSDGAPAPSHADCSHCDTVALASDGAAKIAAQLTFEKSVALAAMPIFAAAPDASNGMRARSLHWAAPPRHSPVSLKIRLRN